MANEPTNITYLTDAATVKLAGNLKLDTKNEEKITLWLPSAKLDTIALIGKEKYDELAELESTDEDKKLASLGEANFCLAYLVPNLNNASSGNGFTKASGVGDGRVEFISQNDIEKMVIKYREIATRLLNKFVVKADSDSETSPSVLDAGPVKLASI